MQQTFVLRAKFFSTGSQNFHQNTAKLLPKGTTTRSIRQQNLHQTRSKSLYCSLKKKFPAHQKFLSYFCHTTQLLAHCADLSKSEGQLCCCHETGLKPVLFYIYRIN